MSQDNIVICSCSLENKAEEIFKSSVEDENLNYSLNTFLESQMDLEIFKIKGNIAATNKGYLCAFYTKDLEHVK